MEIVRLILSILSSSCVIAFSIWYYDRAKSGDDEAFQILQRLFNS